MSDAPPAIPAGAGGLPARVRAESRQAYNPLMPYRPYLLQISRNLLIDEWRARGLPLAEVSSEGLEAAPALEVPVDDALEEGKLRAATSAWCQTLPAELREFLRLRFEGASP